MNYEWKILSDWKSIFWKNIAEYKDDGYGLRAWFWWESLENIIVRDCLSQSILIFPVEDNFSELNIWKSWFMKLDWKDYFFPQIKEILKDGDKNLITSENLSALLLWNEVEFDNLTITNNVKIRWKNFNKNLLKM
jgi:hypothetical protein